VADSDEIKAEIDRTRGELAQTVAALAEKLDPKEQTRKHANQAKAELGARYIQARDNAPPPVHRALDTIEHAAAPVAAKARHKARQHKGNAPQIAAVAVVLLVVVRRVGRRRRAASTS
jgi:hypothetical protein